MPARAVPPFALSLVTLAAVLLALAAPAATAAAAPPSTAAAAASGCDPIDPAACLLPWPNDWFTASDRRSATGRRLALRPGSTPATLGGRHIATAELNRSDGFSPGSMLITRVPGLDAAGVARSRFAPVTRPGRWSRASSPVVVLDARTGRRFPVVAEIDSQASSAARASLLIRPLRNFAEGRRYVVALRDLRDRDGRRIAAPAAFARIRDGRPRGALERRRARSLRAALRTVARDGIPRRSLYLAWDFTVASRASLTGRMLSVRDRAFAELGDRNLRDLRITGRAPAFRVTEVRDFTAQEDPNLLRRVRGELTVPCFLDAAGCPPGSRFRLDRRGMPRRTPGNVAQVPFVCQIPRAVAGAAGPGRPVLYGHGLLGSREELVRNGATTQAANDHDLVFCAADFWGMSAADTPVIASRILPDLSNFPMLADRLQQGLLNSLLLGRAMAHPQGLRSAPAFQVGGRSVFGSARLAYNGNSQGGILGGALTALAPDFTHAALGVPAMNYSTLLDRSIDFDAFGALLYANYARGPERPLLLALIQQLWDRGEANGYAHHMTGDPLPGTPPHQVLLLMALGDHQVANLATAVEARTIGARLRTPAADPGRTDPYDLFWGIREVPRATAYDGSALLAMDSGPLRPGPGGGTLGTPMPPVTNTPPAEGRDPHGLGGSSAEVRRLVARFLADGVLDAGCAGEPCRIGGWAGP